MFKLAADIGQEQNRGHSIYYESGIGTKTSFIIIALFFLQVLNDTSFDFEVWFKNKQTLYVVLMIFPTLLVIRKALDVPVR